MKRSINEFLFIGFLSFPFFILLFHIQNLQAPMGWDWLGVFGYSLLQAALSAAMSLFFGFWGALGLLKIKSQKIFRFFEWILLLPAFLPQVVIISSVLTVITPLNLEFRGLIPVIFIHIIMNAGMCAVAMERIFQTKLRECMDLATLDGVKRWIFHWKVSIPMLIGELKILFAMVFAFCITSFGVPLLVGSSKMSLEVLIYEKMKLNHNWSEAILLAFIQMLLILSLLWPLGKAKSENFKEVWFRTSAFGVLGGILPLLLFTCMAFIGLLWGVEQGVHVWQVNAEGFTMAFWQSFLGTLKITTYSLIFLFLLFCWVAASGPQSKVHWFLTGYLAPSPVLVGFALWSVLPNGGIYSELKISLALSFIFFPSLYRWRAAGVLQGLHRQFVTAQVLGAHRWEIFKKIVFPQFAKDLFWLCGVAGLWVVGDFTVISILGFGQNTLGSLTENLLGSYQLELASVVALIIMIFGFILFWILGMVGNVISQKSYS